jgi:putative ABC transport system substrate-binding protein
MHRRLFILIALVGLFALGIKFFFKPSQNSLPIIAVTQIIEHTTLDTVRLGLIEGLKEAGLEDGKNVRIIYQNAHGQLTTAAQIVKQFEGLKPKVLIALSTQSAQLLQPLALQKKIPLIFSAVTDPVAAKLVTNIDVPATGITGVSDYMDAFPQIHMIKKFIPHLKNLGVLYNPAEVNSTLFLQDAFSKAAHKEGITLIFSPLHNTNEAVSATRSLMGRVDAIYFPNDNTAMASVPAIISIAHKESVPVFANDQASVELGVVAALSYDRIQMGKDTAALAVRGMEEGADLNMPTKIGGEIETIVNKKSMNQLNLILPSDIQTIIFTGDGAP